MPAGPSAANPSGLTVVIINIVTGLTFWPGRVFHKSQLGVIVLMKNVNR